MSKFYLLSTRIGAAVLLMAALGTLSGCDNKEKVIDIETPAGDVEVERDKDTGDVGVDVKKKEDKVVDIETPAGGVEVDRDKDTGDVDVDVDDNE
ncbi:hypothetical protein [Adhaeretor mobilis]|uniref:Uncharacterized protein n=1 Tax=Adhaeretor mobilis TaxID=1930276 RepID=A0A517MX69_9BACT|nr:hypothetical protein [Adhaeretor mobilis]QDS99478.1 hypothetical protein HG15A2_28010 [Adhaeretor mobilis]